MGPVAAEGTGGDHGGTWGPMVPMVPMGTQAPAWTWGMGIAIPMSQFQAGTRACLTQTVTVQVGICFTIQTMTLRISCCVGPITEMF